MIEEFDDSMHYLS